MAEDTGFLEQLVPFWPGIVTLIGFLVVGAFAVWNRRKGNTETRAPSVAEIWAREERVTRRKNFLEHWAFRGQRHFRNHFDRSGETPTVGEREFLEVDLTEPDE